MRRGLTLLETLAAVTLLGLVASATIPLTLRLGQGELAIDERLEAQRWLLVQEQGSGDVLDVVRPVKGHPGWWLHRRACFRTSARPPDDGWTPLGEAWLHLMVRTGTADDAPLLADRLVLVLAAVAPAEAPR
jgi:prepilin-type N-terminal cleavage/methylation domain-containing protein